MEHIVEYKHNRGTEQRVDDTDDDEAENSPVKPEFHDDLVTFMKNPFPPGSPFELFLGPRDYFIDTSPVREATQIMIIDIDISHQFPGHVAFPFKEVSRWVITIYSIKLQSMLKAKLDGLLLSFSFPGCPQYKTITLAFERFERLESEGFHFTDFRISVFDDGAVKIYGNGDSFSATSRLRHIHTHIRSHIRSRIHIHNHKIRNGDGAGHRSR